MVRDEVAEAIGPLSTQKRSNIVRQHNTTSQRAATIKSLPGREERNTTVPKRKTDFWRTDSYVPLCYHSGRPGHVSSIGRPFTVLTDHHSLYWLDNTKDPSRLARWVLSLQYYDIDITYKSGRKHSDADSLSRKPFPENQAENSDEIPSITAIADYKKNQLKDKYLKSMIKILEKCGGYKSYQIRNNVLYKRNYDPIG
ncbi:transposon Ty3-I Gag-Pol polyprotein [Trichonephila clavata]|uniref:Transposon Ty3-I Gag-Pol polyprotein n=1 Tax=Trichonephila clavata TaxID=2740835 RepID=A0A8X6FMT4_TRICU|nr:transposon Ty3-I Gag-Pol polyprotein [Trichonephila clavata]